MTCAVFLALLQCPDSLESGTCSFRSPLAAASTCIRLPVCRAVVVYPNGASHCLQLAPACWGSSWQQGFQVAMQWLFCICPSPCAHSSRIACHLPALQGLMAAVTSRWPC